MTFERPQGPLARLRNLITGLFSGWVRDRENRSPKAVYEQAIAERLKRYGELKDAVAGILYLRNKLEAEIAERRNEMGRLAADIKRAVSKGDDDLALALVGHKQRLSEELDRAEADQQALCHEAETAKDNLIQFREEIRHLQREKGRALAALAGAQARRQVRNVLDGLSVEADVRALDAVREHIAKLGTTAQLDAEMGRDTGLKTRLAEIRSDARHESALRELESVKREMRPAIDHGEEPAEAPPVQVPVESAAHA